MRRKERPPKAARVYTRDQAERIRELRKLDDGTLRLLRAVLEELIRDGGEDDD